MLQGNIQANYDSPAYCKQNGEDDQLSPIVYVPVEDLNEGIKTLQLFPGFQVGPRNPPYKMSINFTLGHT